MLDFNHFGKVLFIRSENFIEHVLPFKLPATKNFRNTNLDQKSDISGDFPSISTFAPNKI
jgi:hypothetical protein